MVITNISVLFHIRTKQTISYDLFIFASEISVAETETKGYALEISSAYVIHFCSANTLILDKY